MKRRCDKCRWWSLWCLNQGRCRRNPPTLDPRMSESGVPAGVWPLTCDNDWCGAFDRKDVTDDEGDDEA